MKKMIILLILLGIYSCEVPKPKTVKVNCIVERKYTDTHFYRTELITTYHIQLSDLRTGRIYGTREIGKTTYSRINEGDTIEIRED